MLEPKDQQYVKVGHIAQSHGVDGTVLIIPELKAPALLDDIDLVRLQNTRGDLIPARMESVRVQEKNNRLSFFVKFDHISDRNEANRLKGLLVYINRAKAKPWLDKKGDDNYASFEVIGEQGLQVGVVDDIIDNPAQAILMVQTGEGELLVPLVDEYVTEIDKENGVIYCHHLNQLSSL